MAYLLAILGLSLLIIVHEAGHMWVARLAGMRVLTFSVGFGPALLRWRGRKTTYQLALIPLGGYVQIAGMNPSEQLPAADTGSYANKSPLVRVATIFAGPLTNYLAAMVIMIGVMLAWGAPRWQHQIGAVEAGSPAARAGMRGGDIITAIAGKPTPGVADVLEGIQGSKGKPTVIQVDRAGERMPLTVTPRVKKGKQGYVIGITFSRKLSFTPVSAKAAVILGAYYPIHESGRALSALGQILSKLVAGKVSPHQVGGPVEIVHQLSLSFRESTVMALIFLAMLSAYLGLFNLLPVPALDGGRLLFLFSTILLRRPVNQRFEHAVHTVGFVLLIGLLLLVTYCDVARQVSSGP